MFEIEILEAYYRNHGPDEADDWRAGRICETVARFSGRAVETIEPADFFPRLQRLRNPPSEEDVKQRIRAWAQQWEA